MKPTNRLGAGWVEMREADPKRAKKTASRGGRSRMRALKAAKAQARMLAK